MFSYELLFLCPIPSTLIHCCLQEGRKTEWDRGKTAALLWVSEKMVWGTLGFFGSTQHLGSPTLVGVSYCPIPGCLQSQTQRLLIEHTSQAWVQVLQPLLGNSYCWRCHWTLRGNLMMLFFELEFSRNISGELQLGPMLPWASSCLPNTYTHHTNLNSLPVFSDMSAHRSIQRRPDLMIKCHLRSHPTCQASGHHRKARFTQYIGLAQRQDNSQSCREITMC